MRITEWLKGVTRPRVEPTPPDTRAFEPLMAALKDADPAVRRQAVIALGDRGERKATEDLIRSLKDSDDDVRLEAVVALGKIGDARAVEPLIEKLKSYDYFYVRKKAAYTLYLFLKQDDLDGQLREKILSHWRSWYLT
jgi:vesicle coat complex subunit